MTDPGPLAGRGALVTGVSRRAGIGFAIASRLASLGAQVTVQGLASHDLEQNGFPIEGESEAVLDELRRIDPAVVMLEADLGEADKPARVVAAAVAARGPLEILVANHARSSTGTLEQVTPDELDRSFAVNARGSILLAQAFAGQHVAGRPGRIVLMTSGQHRGPMPAELAYALSKGAIAQITRTLAAHLMPRGITVNTVNPGPTDTGWADAGTHEAVARAMPTGRWGEPEDAARLVAMLCGDGGAWITGQVIDSDGGFSL